jgi:hypothetical protein
MSRWFESGNGLWIEIASVLKRMIMRRFERCVPGSNPGGGKFGKDEGRRMKDESDECFSDSSFRLHHSSFSSIAL